MGLCFVPCEQGCGGAADKKKKGNEPEFGCNQPTHPRTILFSFSFLSIQPFTITIFTSYNNDQPTRNLRDYSQGRTVCTMLDAKWETPQLSRLSSSRSNCMHHGLSAVANKSHTPSLVGLRRRADEHQLADPYRGLESPQLALSVCATISFSADLHPASHLSPRTLPPERSLVPTGQHGSHWLESTIDKTGGVISIRKIRPFAIGT